MIHDFAGAHILHQGVHGKIPPLGSLFRAQKGIYKHRKIPVASAGGLLPPGHGNVQVIVFKTINAETGAHLCTLPQAVQNALQRLRGHAVNLNVHILILPAQQLIPHQTAHIEDPAALLGNLLGNPLGHLPVLILHFGTSFRL